MGDQLDRLKKVKQGLEGLGISQDTLAQKVQQQLQTSIVAGDSELVNSALSRVDNKAEILYKMDDLYMWSQLAHKPPQQSILWKRYDKEVSELRKALDTATSGSGSDWIPTGFSTDLIDKVRVKAKVASLFEEFMMPSNPYKFPRLLTDPTLYRMVAARGDSATDLKASSTAGMTDGVTFDATPPLYVRVVINTEFEENSPLPVLSEMRRVIVKAIAESIDDIILNGDTSATHYDVDVTDTADHRKQWDGLRVIARKPSTATETDLSTVSLANLKTCRKKMGSYGLEPSELAWIFGVSSYNTMTDATEVRTVDQYGDNATVRTGTIQIVDGIEVVVSNKMREDLNTAGKYDGSTKTDTLCILVRKEAFRMGIRKDITFRRVQDELTDQINAVATLSRDFQPVYKNTETIVSVGYSITS